ncbi:HNH endonuclease [Sunxiuqinia elliptica]
MSNKINVPYKFTSKEQKTINDNFSTHLDWGKDVFKTIKENIINHLRNEQENKCCYCKRELGFDIKEVDIEHIIPKSEYSKFTFHNLNLALSCPQCNTKKSTKPVLEKEYTQYPRNGNAFIIIHAHYDDYSTHIMTLDDCIYVARTIKGGQTINHCELFRFLEVMEKAKKFQTKKSPLAELTEQIRNSSENEVNDLLDAIKQKIK